MTFAKVIRVQIAGGAVRVYADGTCVLRVVGDQVEVVDEREWTKPKEGDMKPRYAVVEETEEYVVTLEMTVEQAVCVRGALAEAVKAISASGRWEGPVAVKTVEAYLLVSDSLEKEGVPRQTWIERMLPSRWEDHEFASLYPEEEGELKVGREAPIVKGGG